MELQFYGANCTRINSKKQNIVVDDNLAILGGTTVTKPSDIVLSTQRGLPQLEAAFIVDMPGEYEIGGISITGIGVAAYKDEPGQKNAVLYRVTSQDTTIAVAGHMQPDLTDEQLENLGLVDVLLLPVGDGGFTLDGAQASKLIRKIEPKVVIPTYYAVKGLKYTETAQSLEEAIAALGMEPIARVDNFRLKDHDTTGSTKLIVLEKQ